MPAERAVVSRVQPRSVFVDPHEGRLRAGWRIGCWLFAVVVAATIGVTFERALVDLAPGGPWAALAAVAGAITLYALVTASTLGVAKWIDRRRPGTLGLSRAAVGHHLDIGRHLAIGLALGVAMSTAFVLVALALGLATVDAVLAVDPGAGVVPGASVTAGAAGIAAPLVLLAFQVPFAVAVGVAEEVLVRGYLLTNAAEAVTGIGPITDRRAVALAIVATGALFGVLHLSNPGASLRSAALITAVGVVLGWTYAASGDLGIPIGIHVTWNLAVAALYGLPVSGLAAPASVLAVETTGPSVFTGGGFGPEAGLLMVVPLAVAVAVTAWWLRREGGSWQVRPEIARFDRADAANQEC